MLELLHMIPDLVVLPLIVAVLAAIAMLAPHAGHRVFRIRSNAARDEGAFDAYKAIMAMVGVVLAFSLVQVNGNLRSAETLVAREASAFAQVDRTLLRFGSDAAMSTRPLLAAYGRSRVDDEWPGLGHGARNATTDIRYTALSRVARALEPMQGRQQAMYSELLKGLDDLAETREMVLQDAETALPAFFWWVTNGFLVLALALAVLCDPTLNRAVGLGASAAAIGLLLAFVIIIDEPYQGETSVTPLAIQRTLILNDRRQ
jgi:hypothetical protein